MSGRVARDFARPVTGNRPTGAIFSRMTPESGLLRLWVGARQRSSRAESTDGRGHPTSRFCQISPSKIFQRSPESKASPIRRISLAMTPAER